MLSASCLVNSLSGAHRRSGPVCYRIPHSVPCGKRDAAVKEAVVRNGAVYLAALGGAGALMAQSVKTLEVIAWPDLGCEAVRRLTVEKMPLTVILDAHGGDLYTSGPAAYLETVK